VLDASKIDHCDRPETTEGHHAEHNIDNIGPDQRGEDEGQRAACTPRHRTGNGLHSVDRPRDGRARAVARQQDAARQENHIGCRRGSKGSNRQPRPGTAAKSSREQVTGTQIQCTEPGRPRPGSGYRQDSTGTLPSVPQRSAEPCRHRSAAPSPRRPNPGT